MTQCQVQSLLFAYAELTKFLAGSLRSALFLASCLDRGITMAACSVMGSLEISRSMPTLSVYHKKERKKDFYLKVRDTNEDTPHKQKNYTLVMIE